MRPVPGGQHLADHLDSAEEVGIDRDARVAHVGCALGGERILRRRREHGDVFQGLDVELVAEEPSPVGQVVRVLNADDGDACANEGRERLPLHVPDWAIDRRMAGVQDDEVIAGVEVVVDDVADCPCKLDEATVAACRKEFRRIDLFNDIGIGEDDSLCASQENSA